MRWEFLILVSNQNKLAFEVISKYQISWIRIMQGAYLSFLFHLTFCQFYQQEFAASFWFKFNLFLIYWP